MKIGRRRFLIYLLFVSEVIECSQQAVPSVQELLGHNILCAEMLCSSSCVKFCIVATEIARTPVTIFHGLDWERDSLE